MTIQDKSRTPRKTTEKVTSEAKKPARVPIGRHRELLTVFGKDPNFHYRWVKDTGESGSRILEYRRAGYEPVNADEITVGEDKIDRSSNERGVVRMAYKGETLFLLKQPKAFRDEDTAAFHAEIDETESQILNPRIDPQDDDPSRQYGKVSLNESETL